MSSFLFKITLTIHLCLLVSVEGFSQQPIFATTYGIGGPLYSFDLANCTRRLIGTTGNFFSDIAFTTDGRLWGITGSQLFSIDTANAQVSLIGNCSTGNSLEGLNDTTLLTIISGSLYGIRTSNASIYLIGNVGYYTHGDLTWYDDDLYIVTGQNVGIGKIVKIVLNSANTAITSVTPIGEYIPYCEGAGTASFPGHSNSIIGFNNSNIIKICHLDGSSKVLCPLLNMNGTPGAASMRLPTQNPKPTDCGLSRIINQYADSMLCAGDSLYVPFSLTDPTLFTAANVFTAQLSDGQGNFGPGAINIGSTTGGGTQPIKCLIPGSITPGHYFRIRIISTDIADTSALSSRPIIIGNLMPPKPVATNNSPLCPGSQLSLFASITSAFGTSYWWVGPNGFYSKTLNPVISSASLTDSGDYIFSLASYGCVNKDTTSALILSNMSSLVAATTTPIICEQDSIKLSAIAPGSPTGFTWSGPAGFSASGKTVIIPNAQTSMGGNYYLTTSYGSCSGTDTVNILVKPAPQDVVASVNSPVCTGDNLQLNGTTSTSGTIFNWEGPGGFSSNSPSTTIGNIQLADSGRYILTVTLNGCNARDTTFVVVHEKPLTPVGEYNNPVCTDDTLFLDVVNISAGASYIWKSNNDFQVNSAKAYKADIKVSDSGYYYVTAKFESCFAYDTLNIHIAQAPVKPVILANLPVEPGDDLKLNIANMQNGSVYTWTGPNGFSSSLVNPVVHIADKSYCDMYTLRVDSSNGCSSSNFILVQYEEVGDSMYLILYPTPNEGLFYVRGITRFDQQLVFRIYDVQGRLVHSGQFSSKNKRFFASIQPKNYLARGDYFFVLRIDGRIRTLRFTVIHE